MRGRGVLGGPVSSPVTPKLLFWESLMNLKIELIKEFKMSPNMCPSFFVIFS
jgi:hypothetical protein